MLRKPAFVISSYINLLSICLNRAGCEVACEELRDFVSLVHRFNNSTHFIERLMFKTKILSQVVISHN